MLSHATHFDLLHIHTEGVGYEVNRMVNIRHHVLSEHDRPRPYQGDTTAYPD